MTTYVFKCIGKVKTEDEANHRRVAEEKKSKRKSEFESYMSKVLDDLKMELKDIDEIVDHLITVRDFIYDYDPEDRTSKRKIKAEVEFRAYANQRVLSYVQCDGLLKEEFDEQFLYDSRIWRNILSYV